MQNKTVLVTSGNLNLQNDIRTGRRDCEHEFNQLINSYRKK